MISMQVLALVLSAGEPSVWHDDFLKASMLAKEKKRDLVIHFREGNELDAALAAPATKTRLSRFVCVRLPIDYVYKGEKMLDREPLSAMRKKAGICIVSRHDESLPTHDQVITALPLTGSQYQWVPSLGTREICIALDLPPSGTLSQRSLIYAVSVHPDAPRCICGKAHSSFLEHAAAHSVRQAAASNLHHADLGTVLSSLSGSVGGLGGASEVVAESFPTEHVLDASYCCVDGWRHSEPHWRSIMAEHKYYGFDLARTANGKWFATGIFAD